MIENVGNKPTASEEVIGGTYKDEAVVGNNVDDTEAIRHPEHAKIHTLFNEEESCKVMKGNKTVAIPGEIILNNQQLTKSVDMEGFTNKTYP